MKKPETDIPLSPGGRYMVEPERYALHLSTGKETKQVYVFGRDIHNSDILSHRNHSVLITKL